MFTKKIPSAAILFFLIVSKIHAQAGFYDLNVIQKIEINFSQSNWDYQLDTAKYGADGYILADWIRINGFQFDSVNVKYKGNSSYDSSYIKNPLHIELDGFINQSYQGITDIKLGNGYADPSVIREVLSYEILENYMDCPRSNFALLYINGSYIGLYSNAESINKDFCSTHFNSSKNTFIKCNPVVIPGPTTKSNLRYIPLADSSAYFNYYEMKSNAGWNDLVQLCDTVTNHASSIGNNLDMDRVLWMLAFNSVLVNLDSYTGVFCQNYYLYKDKTGHFNPIIWDLNMCFGGFPFAGSGNTSMGSLTITDMQQLTPLIHASDPYWPLINAVMSNPAYKKMYIAHARTINNENFVSNSYLASAAQLQLLVDTAVQSDNNSFFSYSQFQNGMTADQQFGSYMVPGISNLINARSAYLQTEINFSYIPPVISSVLSSSQSPPIISTVDITANVTNAIPAQVFMGYRNDAGDKFERVPMYDDGLHNDGAAGDQVFGAQVLVNSLHIDYYIYAENNDAGIFSPERAEHEFYSLNAVVQVPLPGHVTINEFLAGNVTDTVNELGDHADWIELRNNTPADIDLFGLFLSDDFNNLSKFQFPQGTIIPANNYLMVWADEENTSPGYLHCNFKLSVNGEGIWLSDGDSIIADSITFGPQGNDISMGRCPNGTGPFIFLSPPTFNYDNCAQNAVTELTGRSAFLEAMPNPVQDNLFITLRKDNVSKAVFCIRDVLGNKVLSREVLNPGSICSQSISLSFLYKGLYFLEVNLPGEKIVRKIIKL
jgi:hypothetical protein